MARSLRVFDPHIHLWDPYTTPRPVTPLVKLLGRWPKTLDKVTRVAMPQASVNFVGQADYVLNPHLPDIYKADTGKYQVDGYVHIQAAWESKKPMDMVKETVWLEGLEDKPAAIIGQAQLEDKAHLNKILEGHAGVSDRFRGIRDMIAIHPSKGVMDHNNRGNAWKSDSFQEGLSLLGKHNLTFDAYLYSHQLKDFIQLAKATPETKIVLDHLGCPVALAGEHGGVGTTESERRQTLEAWYQDLAEVAKLENVYVKLSGLLMPILGFNFHLRPQRGDIKGSQKASSAEVVDAIGPHIEYGLQTFGIDKCMFASNFPMDKVSVSFENLYDAYFQLTDSFSEEEQHKLFHGNAKSFYQIEN